MKTDRIFVLLLVVLLPLSGCFDGSVGDADATDDSSESDTSTNNQTTIINNYYNNTTTYLSAEQSSTQLFQNGEFHYAAEYDKGSFQNVGGGTSTWVGIPSQSVELLTLELELNQSLMIDRIDIWAVTNYTDCLENHSQESRCTTNSGMTQIENAISSYSGFSTVWDASCSQGLEASPIQINVGMTAPFAGSDCDFTLAWSSQYNADTVFWSISYFVSEISEGPHN